MPAGFVKDDNETNEEYLATFETDDPWLPIVTRAHERLLVIDPAYQIVQIKAKFGGLRYYFDTQTGNRGWMDDVVRDAEREIDTLEGH